MKTDHQVKSRARHASWAGPSPADDDQADIDFDDPTIDEALLPPMDLDDPELLGRDAGYDDLLDRKWLERTADDEEDEDGVVVEPVGFTIELNGPSVDDDAQVVDLDVGSLLTSLPGEGTELELDSRNDSLRGVGDGSLTAGVLRDMLLPDTDEDDMDDGEIGDDDRFPAFDDASDIGPRPGREDTDDSSDNDPIDNDELT
jgi:hypothetical protein